jgi:hypothetical protein
MTSSDEQDPYFITYHGSEKEASAAVTEVELRYPGPRSTMKDGLVIISVSPNLKVTIDEVRAWFGQEGSYNPRPAEAPSSAPYYTSYGQKETRLSFGFLDPASGRCSALSGYLMTVVIDRTNC